jgi:hypothetical protein
MQDQMVQYGMYPLPNVRTVALLALCPISFLASPPPLPPWLADPDYGVAGSAFEYGSEVFTTVT